MVPAVVREGYQRRNVVTPPNPESGRAKVSISSAPDEVFKQIRQLELEPASLKNDAILSELWKSLGASLGREAMLIADRQTVDKRRSAMNALLGWAAVAPREAWDYAFRESKDLGRTASVALTSSVLRSGNFGLVAELVPKIEDPALRTTMAAISASHLARYSPEDAAALLEQLDEKSLGQALGAIASDWGDSDPVSTMNWLFRQSGMPIDNAINQVVRSWVESGGYDAARTWLTTQPASESRAAAARAYLTTSRSMQGVPDPALLRMLSVKDAELIANIGVQRNIGRDNSLALDWALTISDAAERFGAVNRIAGGINSDDALKLVQIIQNHSSLDNKAKSELIHLLDGKRGP